MKRIPPIVVALSLGLFITSVGCDTEPAGIDYVEPDQPLLLDEELEIDELAAEVPDEEAEPDDAYEVDPITELQMQLEAEHGVALELIDRGDGSRIRWTEVDDLTEAPSGAICPGTGYYEYEVRPQPCEQLCTYYGTVGRVHESYKRWCWDGPPSCGGCGGWQYISWSCNGYCDDGSDGGAA